MNYSRRLPSGYSDLGPIQIPPRPQQILLTDRETGAIWLVSYNLDTLERLSINSSYSTMLENREGIRRYAAYDGPTIGENNEFTLFVRNGHIGIDFKDGGPADVARDTAPAYAFTGTSFQAMFLDTRDYLTAHIGLRT